MTEQLLSKLRALRKRGQIIHSTLVDDLAAFKEKDSTFKRLPTPRDKNVSVTTTCTALMALVVSDRLKEFYKNAAAAETRAAFKKLLNAKWASSGLPDDNAFTSSLVIRAAGFLKQIPQLGIENVADLRHGPQTLSVIARFLADDFRERLRVQGYPLKPAIVYWFVDGVENLEIPLKGKCWKDLAQWTAQEFGDQLSSVVAANDALMDPVSLIMAACLAQRIRRACDLRGLPPEILHLLPSEVELRHAVSKLFDCQTKSGTWPKYFPLFHFKDAGANHCFSFEFLEAMLSEFELLLLIRDEHVLDGIERVLSWCELNRRRYRFKDQPYFGWHSGGDISTLKEGKPECWATATVHMFLCRLCESLSKAIQELVFIRYGVTAVPEPRVTWDELLDADVTLQGNPTTVKKVLEKYVVTPFVKNKGVLKKSCISALLFGPPGTSKTTLATLVAKRLKRKLVEITPSQFLDRGLENIYIRADEIFEDLMDLRDAVVLFDEMDALVQSRDSEGASRQLDVTQQFLTTSMLPKLAKLHDQGMVVFFMATNHRKSFDPAILRPGRFDILLCVSPPTWEQKRKAIRSILKLDPSDEDASKISEKLNSLTSKNRDARSELDRFTFDELGTFLRAAISKSPGATFTDKVGALSETEFSELVSKWSTDYITLRGAILKEYELDKIASRLQA